jgi:uncharacterized repeat protein (TIGR01451 family)
MTELRRWFIAATILNLSIGLAGAQPPYLISTYAGGVPAPTAAIATNYSIQNPNGVATDQFGNTYLSTASNCVFRLDPNGYLSRVAGTCRIGFSGDGGSAVDAALNSPQGVAVDIAGNLYISDQGNQRIRRVTPNGIINTVAGNGTAGFAGDKGPATSAELNSPKGVAVDLAGNLYIADQQNEVIRKVSPAGIITTFAGQGFFPGMSGDGGPATSATLNFPVAVAVDSLGNLFIGDGSYQVRKVNSGGTISHVAGTGVRGYNGNPVAAQAQLSLPAGLAVDLAGDLYIADEYNQLVERIDPSGNISTFAGGGATLGDGGPAVHAELHYPLGVAADNSGNVYIADQVNRLRKVTGNVISTAVGNGSFPFSGDGGPANLAQFSANWGIAYSGTAGLYVADSNNYRVRNISPAGIITTIAGTGANLDTGDGGPATSASVTPNIVAVDAAGNVYLADTALIRKITPSGMISTVAGTGMGGYSGDNGPATSANISGYIPGLAVDSNGNIYISDWNNDRVRKVTPGGTITTVAGNGNAAFTGDNGPATSAELNYPAGLAVDGQGNLYISDYNNLRVRKLTVATGFISTVAGNGNSTDSGDGSSATAAGIANPWAVAVDGSGNLYIATSGNSIRAVSPAGIISTIAGTGLAGYSGDGGPATLSLLNNPKGIAVGSGGNLYVSDSGNGAIRVLQPETEPVLTVSSAHTGLFTVGQQGVIFTVTASNAASAASTSGTVTVTDILPGGLTPVSMGGTGWSCTYSSPAYSCQNSGPASGGSSFGALTLIGNVAAGALPQITNQVTVSGGGSLGSGAVDPAFIAPAHPVLEIAATHLGNFVAGSQASFTIVVGNQDAAAPTSGTVTVTDTLPAGLTLISLAGSGWNCTGATCTINASLAGGAGYNPITGTVNVASNAGSPETNQVAVSGGGSASAGASDSITVVPLGCLVAGGSSVTVTDIQDVINEALGTSSAVHDLNHDGKINLVDAQIVINSFLGLGCTL